MIQLGTGTLPNPFTIASQLFKSLASQQIKLLEWLGISNIYTKSFSCVVVNDIPVPTGTNTK